MLCDVPDRFDIINPAVIFEGDALAGIQDGFDDVVKVCLRVSTW